ncbi:type II toxin-antitoxin system ParD family antitoxin [Novosphingobium sp. 9]|uniref:type II toxin-antitoxin system ParD family antitoxin n=1 Tax=Novosphingobium sp. 9 TaxID=2025349 RepID=UPI0021B561D2|nr:type II toxin-antitoxin system ParD family antitoxin [Novosphingobium sp. 9]
MNSYTPAMSQLNVTMPPALRQWIETRVAEGRYANASDYVRDLVRRDQDAAQDETEWLRGMIAQGLASGVIEENPRDVIEQIIAERRSTRG